MVFSSIVFLWLFMPLVLAVYVLMPARARNTVLALLSLLFYAWGARSIIFVFLASIFVNYLAGRAIGQLHGQRRDVAARRVMWAAIVFDLAVLFVWKYAASAVSQVDELLHLAGPPHAIPLPAITLPIGISFFTFHAISYVVDITRRQAQPMRHVADYAQYMAFFPQLIAGPIIRYHEIEEQIRNPPRRVQRAHDLAEGFPRFVLGLSKKVLIADQVSGAVNAVFAHPAHLNSGAAWVGALAYTVQIYFDFSGYSDMAIGLGRMFGFQFPENFARPYSSLSMTDFWRRWHMTLSRWFRDYLYIPLGGSRVGNRVTYRNLLLVFLLVGLWHGAAWPFVLWGLYNGGLLVFERRTGIRQLSDDRAVVARRVTTFLLVVLGWVLFRATSVGDAIDIYRAMFSFDFGALPDSLHQALTGEAVLALGIGLASVALPRSLVFGRVLQMDWSGAPLLARTVVLVALPVSAMTVAAGSFSPFLYFRF